MNIAEGLALSTATLSFTASAVAFAISRAPGWRFASSTAALGLTAGLYGLGNLVFTRPGLPDATYLAAANWNYTVAALHIVAWQVFVFGGPDGRIAALPPRVKGLVCAIVAAAAIFPASGVLLQERVVPFDVPWAGVTYHYGRTTLAGDLYQAFLVGALALPFAELWRRAVRGDRDAQLVVVGFTLFIATGVVEALVASRVIAFVSPADLGFLVVVAPGCAVMVRRFVADARRLRRLSSQLAGEVRDRTEERDRAEAALRESERLAALGQLAAGVGHEINNPLMYLQMALSEIDEELGRQPSPRAAEALDAAREGAHRIERVVDGLRTYSRRQAEFVALDPPAVVQAALRLAQPHVRHVAELKVALDPSPRVLGDEPRLVQALVNLLVNAAQAASGGAQPGLVTVRSGATQEGDALLAVEDNGPGIHTADLAHITEPYFTTRARSGGLGLGLFVTRGIVDAHGGRLEFDSNVGRGTRARIVLPALSGEARAAEAHDADRECAESPATLAASPPRGDGAPPRLLLVDDEPTVLRFLSRALAPSWDVVSASNGAEALHQLAKSRFDAVLCDLEMPQLSGVQLAAELERIDPALRRATVFVTGGAVTPEACAFLERADVAHLAKPVRLAALTASLQAALARREASGAQLEASTPGAPA